MIDDEGFYHTPDSWLMAVFVVSDTCAGAVGYYSGVWDGLLAWPLCIVIGVALCRLVRP